MKIPLDDPKRIQVLVVMTPAQLQQIIAIEHSMGVSRTLWGFRYSLVVWALLRQNMDTSELMGALQTYATEDGLEVVPRNNVRIPFTIRPYAKGIHGTPRKHRRG